MGLRAGDPFLFDLALYDAGGAGLSYADAATFTGAGWTAMAIDMSTGVAAIPAVDFTLAPVAGVTGRHVFRFDLPDVAIFWRITPPTVAYTYNVLPGAIADGSVNSLDTIYARLDSIYGVTTATTVPGVTMNPLVEGDSYKTTITVPASYLARMGWTDLTGCTLDGTIREPDDIGTGDPAVTLTQGDNLAINGSNAAAFDVYWDDYPTGMVLTGPQRAAGQAVFRMEVQAKKDSKVLTIAYNCPLPTYRQDDVA